MTVHADPGHCITCSDEGCEVVVIRVDEARALALCEAPDGARSSVEIALVDDVRVGETLLTHAGTALTRMQSAA